VKKRAVIIGASTGIGRAVAQQLIREGYTVGLASRRLPLLQAIQNQAPSPADVFVQELDLRAPEEARRRLEALIEAMGGADLVIVNAAVDVSNPDMRWEASQEILAVNVVGFVAVCETALHLFLKQGHGHLAGVSSIAGIMSNGRAPVYSASKAFVSQYLNNLRLKFHDKKIVITDLIPGFVATDMLKNRSQTFWMASPEKAAAQILKAIEQKKTHAFITGRWVWIVLLYRCLPGWLYRLLYRIAAPH